MAILTSYWVLDVASLVVAALAVAYLFMTRRFNYWPKRGVTEIRPTPFVGNFLDCCLLRQMPGVQLELLYKQGKGLPYLGIYIFDKPTLLLRDPAMIKTILTKDFEYFQNRHVRTYEGDAIARTNSFLMTNPNARTVRNSLSPIFTSGKLKNMFPLMLEVGKNLAIHLESRNLEGSGRVLEIKEISARFMTDVITSCAFGLDVNSLNDPNSAFREIGVEIFGFATYKRSVEVAAFFFAPELAELMKFRFFAAKGSNFIRKVINDAIKLRMETNTRRNDLIDLLIAVKKSQSEVNHPNGFVFDGDNLTGLAATFFAAGFETSSTSMAFSLYELALQPKLQTRLREEIVAALEETGGEITYEMVMNLPYLDMVISESLRKYPSLPFLDRVATRDYEVPGTGLVIERGTPVYIPMLGLHNDPEYFPEPEKFDPERFSKENKKNIPPGVYVPFGDGPRNCVGLRFGLLQGKLGILRFLLNHEVTVCDETQIPAIFDPKGSLLKPRDGMYLNVRTF